MKITETATTIVSLLGGPALNAEDIDWALDLPAGQKLLEWLVSQVEIPSADDGTDRSDALRAALQAISLEDDEVKMLRHATKKTHHSIPATGTIEAKVPSGYIPPFRAREKEEYLLVEAARLEAETESLKSRLHQAKIASQSLTKAAKFLASEIEKTEGDIQVAEDGLSELSLQADAAILGSVNGSLGLIDGCIPSESAKEGSLLSAVSSARAAITDRFQSQMAAIDATAHRLPTPTGLQVECRRLDTALRKIRETGEDPDTGKNALAAVLKEKPEAQVQRFSSDVAAKLETAWARDQADLLDARGAVLDEAIKAFSDSILPPLTALHHNLAANNAHMDETQALIGALHEEIQDIVDDVRAAKEPQEKTGIPSAAESKDPELQAELTRLLKQLKDLRPRDAPPLILLSEEDILSELRDVYKREEDSWRQEEEWIAGLLPTLRSLETVHAPLLDAAYANSPMNSSAPFSVPPHIQAVHVDAKSKADGLGDTVSKLQEDVKPLTSDRAKRRMEHFVAKWAK
ncbi:hypothetical protein MVEN_00587100 [Mycena venus]|uniref:Uncharacterized protein n=1 Tax=Mycena venus TaxID=2733690 RepID=A0A8H6YNR6_9AGAR|nr:hypothetical protein MVEN_00587100 [Mycena venus]